MVSEVGHENVNIGLKECLQACRLLFCFCKHKEKGIEACGVIVSTVSTQHANRPGKNI